MIKCYCKKWNMYILLFLSLCMSYKASDTLHAKLKTGSLYAALGTSFIGLNELWYKSYKSASFHVFNDSKEWYQMDKLGHLYSCFHITTMGLEMPAQHIGQKTLNTVSGLLFLSGIEVLDAYSTGWGFSKSDMLANVLGCASAIALHKSIAHQMLYFKFGYWPSPYADQNPKLLGQNGFTRILKDYNGQSYWLSCSLKYKFWPKWLALSLGYGITGFIHAYPDTLHSKRLFKCSIDFNPNAIKSSKGWLKPIKWIFKYVKFPFPSLAFNEKKVFLTY